MELLRLCRRPHADLSGEGARIFGGRWNSPGRPVVYLAEHPALAALELRVHLDLPFELLPNDFVLMRVLVPDGLIAEVADVSVAGSETVATGDAWLTEGRSMALRVPRCCCPTPGMCCSIRAFRKLLTRVSPASSRSTSTRACGNHWRPNGDAKVDRAARARQIDAAQQRGAP